MQSIEYARNYLFWPVICKQRTAKMRSIAAPFIELDDRSNHAIAGIKLLDLSWFRMLPGQDPVEQLSNQAQRIHLVIVLSSGEAQEFRAEGRHPRCSCRKIESPQAPCGLEWIERELLCHLWSGTSDGRHKPVVLAVYGRERDQRQL